MRNRPLYLGAGQFPLEEPSVQIDGLEFYLPNEFRVTVDRDGDVTAIELVEHTSFGELRESAFYPVPERIEGERGPARLWTQLNAYITTQRRQDCLDAAKELRSLEANDRDAAAAALHVQYPKHPIF